MNATGPWSEKIARMAGVDVPIVPSPAMLAVRGRLCNMVLNRMQLVRRRRHHRSSAGTFGRRHEFVDGRSRRPGGPRGPPPADVGRRRETDPRHFARRVPGRVVGGAAADRVACGRLGAELSRTFKTIDHADDGVHGFVTRSPRQGVTTLRGMAELCGNVIRAKLGIDRPTRTRTFVTPSQCLLH